MAIQRMLSALPDECDVYGIGSFFKGVERFRDVDLVVVTSDISTPATSTKQFRHSALQAGREIGIKFDITVLTRSEFAGRPLRDMEELILVTKLP